MHVTANMASWCWWQKITSDTGLQVVRKSTVEEDRQWVDQHFLFAHQVHQPAALAAWSAEDRYLSTSCDHDEDAGNVYIILPLPPLL